MRILITNAAVAELTGTVTWVRDFSLALVRRGHFPLVYTPHAGLAAEALRDSGVPVVTRLGVTGPAPDLVHGHHPQAAAALAHHRTSPGIFVAHDFTCWTDAPPLLPRIYRYVAVDEPNRDRLVAGGAPPGRTIVIPNAVDLARFPSRGPLPRRPRRALLFSNWAMEQTCLPAVREACTLADLSLDVAGYGSGNPVARPEEILGRYDVVFAKARCALEALATGCAVILCDAWGLGSLVTAADVARMRPLNFGRKLLTRPVTTAGLVEEIARYDAGDATEASGRVRAAAGLEEMVERFLGLYEDAILEHRSTKPHRRAERRAFVAYALGLPLPRALFVGGFPARFLSWLRNTRPFTAILSFRSRQRLLLRLGRPGFDRAGRGAA